LSEPDFEGKSFAVAIFEGEKIFSKGNCREKNFLQDKFEGKEEEKHRFSSLKSFLANLFGTRKK